MSLFCVKISAEQDYSYQKKSELSFFKMKCEMHRCCCFNNSNDASFASGIYTTIISITSIICFAVIHAMPSTHQHISIHINPVASIISLMVMILFFIFSLILLYGVIKTKRLALIPWMVWMIIVITLDCIGVILIIVLVIQLSALSLLIYLLLALPFIGLNITCFIVVKTHYQTLSSIPVTVDEEAVNYLSLKS